jgi:hypothetical protein
MQHFMNARHFKAIKGGAVVLGEGLQEIGRDAFRESTSLHEI